MGHTAKAKISTSASPKEAATYILSKSIPSVLLPLLRSQAKVRSKTTVEVANQLCELVGRSLVCFISESAKILCPYRGEKDYAACFRMQGSTLTAKSYAYVFKTLLPALDSFKLHRASQITYAAAIAFFFRDGFKDDDLQNSTLHILLCPSNNATRTHAASRLLNELVASQRVNVVSISSRIVAATLLLRAGADTTSTDLIRRAAQLDGPLFGLLTQWHPLGTGRIVGDCLLARGRNGELSRSKLRAKRCTCHGVERREMQAETNEARTRAHGASVW